MNDLNDIKKKLSDLYKDNHNPMYTPYVGENYKGVLIVGESHYINVKWVKEELKKPCVQLPQTLNPENVADYIISCWGTQNQKELDEYDNGIISDWYNTSAVVGKYLKRKADRELGNSYLYFKQIDNASEQSCRLNMSNFAFMNYYQIPSLKPGKSIFKCFDIPNYKYKLQKYEKISLETFKQTIRLLKPKVVIITAKIFDKNTMQDLSNKLNTIITRVQHPSCPWWNRKSKDGKSGRDRFIEELKKIFDKK